MEIHATDTRKDLLKMFDLKKFSKRLVWKVNNTCNFKCPYCLTQFEDKSKEVKVYSPDKIHSFFNRIGKPWLIMITGGEPFIYPHFVDICKELEEDHILQISSNLSTENIYEFADRINPERFFLMSASFHPTERNNIEFKKDFMDKCKYLREKGFTVLINYVASPSILPTMEEDFVFFATEGFNSFALIMRGMEDGKKYPESYSGRELEIIKKYLIDSDIEVSSAYGKLNYYGRYCAAGKDYFVIDAYGEVSRCSTLYNKTGNFFKEGFALNEKLKPCITKNCNDGHCGVAAISDKKASFLRIYKEKKAYERL